MDGEGRERTVKGPRRMEKTRGEGGRRGEKRGMGGGRGKPES